MLSQPLGDRNSLRKIFNRKNAIKKNRILPFHLKLPSLQGNFIFQNKKSQSIHKLYNCALTPLDFTKSVCESTWFTLFFKKNHISETSCNRLRNVHVSHATKQWWKIYLQNMKLTIKMTIYHQGKQQRLALQLGCNSCKVKKVWKNKFWDESLHDKFKACLNLNLKKKQFKMNFLSLNIVGTVSLGLSWQNKTDLRKGSKMSRR